MTQYLVNWNNSIEKDSIPCLMEWSNISSENWTTFEQPCAVCMESKPFQDFAIRYSKRCTHPNRSICDSCIYEHVRNTWNLGNDIYCPECTIPFSHATIKLIFLKHNDTTLYERYTKFDLDRGLEQHPEFIWCAHGCGSGQLNEGATMNNTVHCINCRKLTCFKHKSPWHDGMTCEEYDLPRTDGQQHACRRWIDEHTKKCPNCPSHIEKNEGCDHMTCLKCKHEFCWLCFAPYSAIKRRGAYLHRRTCAHYPATDTRNIFKRFADLF